MAFKDGDGASIMADNLKCHLALGQAEGLGQSMAAEPVDVELGMAVIRAFGELSGKGQEDKLRFALSHLWISVGGGWTVRLHDGPRCRVHQMPQPPILPRSCFRTRRLRG